MAKKAAASLLWRTAAFLIVFVVLSGILGSRIISRGLVHKYGFEVYGGAGKALLFGAIALLLLVNKNKTAVKLRSWHWQQIGWIILSVAAAEIAWFGVGKLITANAGAGWPILVHGMLLASIIFAAYGVFGAMNVRSLARAYRRELLVAAGLAVVFFGFLYLVYGLWQILAATVLHAVGWMLRQIGLAVSIMPPRTLLLSKFGVTIAQTCSGIESIALFSGLYGLVGVLDWPRLNHRKYWATFLPALILLFGCNILRVFGLIVAGYYINPHIAFSLFHTYAGMVFFIIYSGIFWSISYKWMLRTKELPKRPA